MNVPGTENPLSHTVLELDEFPYPPTPLWGNKNWPPSMKVKKMEIFQNKRGLKGCKLPSLNAQGTENHEAAIQCGIHATIDRIPFRFYKKEIIVIQILEI